MKKLAKITLWFLFAVPSLVAMIVFASNYTRTQGASGLMRQEARTFQGSSFSFASLPKIAFEIKTALAREDARPIVIEKYMRRWDSPMLDYAKYIVDVADAHDVDPYLVVAIAQQESNLGKLMPPDCHNAWGWGIHSRGTLCFDNWEEGINTFISGLADNYLAYGLHTPEEIMTKYNATSPDGAWAKGVSYFLEQLHAGNF